MAEIPGDFTRLPEQEPVERLPADGGDQVLYVATYRHRTTGELMVMAADPDLDRALKDAVFMARLHRIVATTRIHWLAGVRRWPFDPDSVTTRAYRPAEPRRPFEATSR